MKTTTKKTATKKTITKKTTIKNIKAVRKVSNATLFKRTRKPSVLLKIALEDLIKCEKDKKYKIDMSAWYQTNSHCTVCMAGAVLAQTLKKDTDRIIKNIDYDIDLIPSDFTIIGSDIKNKLEAIDFLRRGDIECALNYLNLDYPKTEMDIYINIINYKDSPILFKKDIRRLIKYLEKHGY